MKHDIHQCLMYAVSILDSTGFFPLWWPLYSLLVHVRLNISAVTVQHTICESIQFLHYTTNVSKLHYFYLRKVLPTTVVRAPISKDVFVLALQSHASVHSFVASSSQSIYFLYFYGPNLRRRTGTVCAIDLLIRL